MSRIARVVRFMRHFLLVLGMAVIVVALYILFSASLRHQGEQLIVETWEVLVTTSSMTTFGILMWSMLLSFAFWCDRVYELWRRLEEQGQPKAFSVALKANLRLRKLIIASLIMIPTFGIFVVRTLDKEATALRDRLNALTTDKQSLEAENARLKGSPVQKQLEDAQHEIELEREQAKNWQEAYERISHGEMTPDRYLDKQDEETLRDMLRKAAAASPANRKWATVSIGCIAGDREACRLATQLYQIFSSPSARWNISWMKEPTGEFKKRLEYTGPVGLSIWTPAPQNEPQNPGTFLMYSLQDVGLKPMVNPANQVPDMKDTVIWVGYKQWP